MKNRKEKHAHTTELDYMNLIFNKLGNVKNRRYNQTKILIKCSSDQLKLPALTDYGHMIK